MRTGSVRPGVLGPLAGDRLVDPVAVRAPKQRLLLALLMVEADRSVPTDLLVDELWDGDPPVSWATTLQTYVYQLRRHTRDGAPGHIRTTRSGYRLEIDPALLDWHQFECLIEVAARTSCPVRTAAGYRSALGLWRGPVLSDVDRGPRLLAVAGRLDTARRAAQAAHLAALHDTGRFTDVITEARAVLVDDPLDTDVHVYLIRSLAARGRRHDAIRHARHFHRRLREHVGPTGPTAVDHAYLEILQQL